MSTAGQVSRRVRTERSSMSISDFEREMFKLEGDSESVNILVHGDSNVGKTWFAGTCPGRTYWLVCEPGYKSAARNGATGYGHRIADTATALAAIDWLNYKRRYERFDWIVLDGLSTMQDRFRLAYAAEAFDVSGGTKRQHRNLPDKPDYFNTQNFLKSWIPQLVDLPCNFLITAHSYRTDDTEGGELLVYPGIQGKVTEVANAISGLMDITGYFESRRIYNDAGDKSKISRRLWFESPPRNRKGEDVRYICGEKFNAFGQYMVNPTIPKIMEKISG